MKFEKILLLNFLIYCLIFIFCSKKTTEPIVAKAGATKITINEFHERYEFTPQTLQTKNKELNKRNFLFNLLGEKVFTEEARNRKLHKTDRFKTYAKQMEKEAVVEALFEKEITLKIEVTTEELRDAYVKSKQELKLQILHFDNHEDAAKAKELIAEGKSFHDVKRLLQSKDFISVDSVLTLSLKWGEAHPDIENAAFLLKPNEVSGIVYVENNYFIMKLVNKKQQLYLTEADFYQQIPSLKKVIRQRKSTKMFDEFFHSVMDGKRLVVPHEVFNFVAEELATIYLGDKNQQGLNDSTLEKKGVETALLSESLFDHLNDTFARFDDGTTWTVGEFVKNLSVGPYPLDNKSKERFIKSLRRAVRRMAEFESLAKKGNKLGLNEIPYVKYQTQMWNDAYIARLLQGMIIDTIKVTDAEIKYYYDHHTSEYLRPEMLKLQEILLAEEHLAKKLYQRIQQGEDMAKLARQYSKRDLTRDKGGVSGFFTTQSWGEIGKIAKNFKIGELGGPVKTEKNQYSIFKVIEKIPKGPIPFDEIYKDARSDALNDKRQNELDRYLTEFSKKYDIKIYPAVYDSIKTYDISMLVFKRHFPSRYAAPLVTPLRTYARWQNKMDSIFPKKSN